MKTIHFFGCSFTAGHELPDDTILPWKKNCKTTEEYYARTKSNDPASPWPCSLEEYIEMCKSMAYPSIIERNNPSWKCINYSAFGSSIRQEIFKAMTLIETGTEPIDFLVFQIPHYTREFVVTANEDLESFSINFPLTNSPEFNAYLEKSVMFHSVNHWAFQGHLDLVLFEGYLLSKNIKFLFLDLEGTNADSIKNLKLWPLRMPDIHNLQRRILGRLLGNHLDLATHNSFAYVIAEKIKKTI